MFRLARLTAHSPWDVIIIFIGAKKKMYAGISPDEKTVAINTRRLDIIAWLWRRAGFSFGRQPIRTWSIIARRTIRPVVPLRSSVFAFRALCESIFFHERTPKSRRARKTRYRTRASTVRRVNYVRKPDHFPSGRALYLRLNGCRPPTVVVYQREKRDVEKKYSN